MSEMNVREDEINLYDYWKVIVKRKTLIIGLFLVAIIAAGIISLSMPKTYKVMTVLEIGKTIGTFEDPKQVKTLEDPKQVKTKVEAVYPFKTISRLNIPEEEFPKIKTEIPKDTSLVNIAIESSKPEFAVKILDDIVKQAMEEHGSLISNFKIDIANKIKTLDLQIGLLKKERETVISKGRILEKNKAELLGQIQRIDSRIQSLLEEKNRLNLQANPDNALSNLLFTNEVQSSQRYRNELEDRLKISLPKEELGLKMELERIGKGTQEAEIGKELLQNQINTMQETKVVRPPSYSKFPIKPRIKMNIAIAGIASLFTGIFLAFFAEYVERIRKEE